MRKVITIRSGEDKYPILVSSSGKVILDRRLTNHETATEDMLLDSMAILIGRLNMGRDTLSDRISFAEAFATVLFVMNQKQQNHQFEDFDLERLYTYVENKHPEVFGNILKPHFL